MFTAPSGVRLQQVLGLPPRGAAGPWVSNDRLHTAAAERESLFRGVPDETYALQLVARVS